MHGFEDVASAAKSGSDLPATVSTTLATQLRPPCGYADRLASIIAAGRVMIKLCFEFCQSSLQGGD